MKLVFLALLLAAQCGAVQALHFENRHLSRHGACWAGGCSKVDFSYVEAVGGSAAVRQRINAALLGCIRDTDDSRPLPLEAAKSFLSQAKQSHAETPSFTMNWWLRVSLRLLRRTENLISLECEAAGYSGGAHGQANTRYLNLDPHSGQPIGLEAILKGGSLARLNSIAEVHFREVRKLGRDADLFQAGFTFTDNKFELNENFGVSRKALLFHYDAYEISSYATGPTDIAIPWPEIAGRLRPEFASLAK